MELLREGGYMTVSRLSEMTYTSESSIRRDLAHLQTLSLVRRTHGGVSLPGDFNHAVPYSSRMEQNIAEKRKIAKRAAALLTDGQSVMLDGSSTAGFLVPYIAMHKDMILFTNNMLTAISAVNHGIETHCIGGCAIGGSAVLSGEQAYTAIEKISPDMLFFSSQCIDSDGYIYDPIPEESYIRTLMLRSARCRVFLCDSGKFGHRSLYRLTNANDIDVCVFDQPYPALHVKCRMID